MATANHTPRFEPITGPVDKWLRLQGLEVVAASWGGAYPMLYTRRVVGPPLRPCAHCGHAEAVHEDGGPCIALDCACEVYCPPLEERSSDGSN